MSAPTNYYRPQGPFTRRPGALAAKALFEANLHALFSLARCDYCGRTFEEVGGGSHDARFGYACERCDA